MIEGEAGDLVVPKLTAETGPKPGLFTGGMTQGLNVNTFLRHGLSHSPGDRTTGAGLLGNGQCDPLIQCSGQ